MENWEGVSVMRKREVVKAQNGEKNTKELHRDQGCTGVYGDYNWVQNHNGG